MGYHVGDRKTVVGNNNKHKFKLGTKIEIISLPDKLSYLCAPMIDGKADMFSIWYFVYHEDLGSLSEILEQL